jgi:hypothetical protein
MYSKFDRKFYNPQPELLFFRPISIVAQATFL